MAGTLNKNAMARFDLLSAKTKKDILGSYSAVQKSLDSC